MRRRLALFTELRDEAWPFRPKDIGTGQGTVTSANDERVDAFFYEVECGGETTLRRAERC